MNNPQRLHALDGLRALMMWLGIVLHVSIQHLARETPLPWRDRETTLVADFLFIFIHTFRMPVFFILAGFFVAMLVHRRGYWGMLKHRLRRIGLPFIIFWPLIFAGTVALIVVYFNVMIKGAFGLDVSIMPAPKTSGPDMINPMHMWFMYYLLLFCFFTALFGLSDKYISGELKNGISALFYSLSSRWWGFLVLAIPLALVSPFNRDAMDTSGVSFVPQLDLLLHNGLFFVFGWYLYRSQDSLLKLYSKNCWRYIAAGLLFFALALALLELNSHQPEKNQYVKFCIALTYNFATWLWSFALIGLFLRYLPDKNRFLQYMSESSYWVYLVHLMGTIGFGAILYNLPFGALTKMGLNILATTLTCVLTYHVLVRYTPIGTLLNGRRFSRKEKPDMDKNILAV